MKALAVLSIGIGCAVAGEGQPLTLKQTIPLPGVSGRFDHFAVDAAGQRLFVAALGNDTVEVIDLAKFVRSGTIREQRKPQGVLYLAEAGRLFVANGGDGTFRVVDGKSLAPIGKLGAVDDADNVRWDAKAQRIYIGFGDGALGITDTSAAKLLGQIELKGHPESFQLEHNGPRIFVNVPDAKWSRSSTARNAPSSQNGR